MFTRDQVELHDYHDYETDERVVTAQVRVAVGVVVPKAGELHLDAVGQAQLLDRVRELAVQTLLAQPHEFVAKSGVKPLRLTYREAPKRIG